MLCSIGLYLPFLVFNTSYSATSLVFTVMASVSTVAFLYLLFAILLIPLLWNKFICSTFALIVFVVVDLAIVMDFFIFRLYKMHINPMVLNLVFSPAAQDSVHIGYIPLLAIAVCVAVFLGLNFALLKKLAGLRDEYTHSINRKSRYWLVLPLVLISVTEKFAFGFATLENRTEITRKVRVIPMYLPLTFNRFAAKHFGHQPPPKIPTLPEDSSLNYPKQHLQFGEVLALPHIFIFCSDATRDDMLSPEVMPYLWSIRSDFQHFRNHHSGGNTTRFGVFSLLYGLNSTYWFSFLNEQRGSLLFEALKRQGYNLNVTSSTNLRWPEFRRTAFTEVQDAIKDDFKGSPWQKDQQTQAYFLNWLEQQDVSKPLFSFVFLDAPHSPYSYPGDQAYFKPDEEGRINYMTVGGKDKEVLLNMYKNANRYVDGLYEEIIRTLKEKGIYDESIIIFTADHGEEFFEFGSYGHNSAFSDAQTGTLMMMKMPGESGGSYDKYTTHMDIVPTLMQSIGVTNPASDYANGSNIFDADHDYVFVSNWNNYSIKTASNTLVFSRKPNAVFTPEVRVTHSYELDDSHSISDFSHLIRDSLEANSAFFK